MGPARYFQIDLRSTMERLNLSCLTLVQAHHGKELHMLVVIDLVQNTLPRLKEELQMTLDMGVEERILHMLIIIDMVVWRLVENQNLYPSLTLEMKLAIFPLYITAPGLSRLLTVELATRWGYITPHKEILNAILWPLYTMLILIQDKVYVNQQHTQTSEIPRPKTLVLGPH